jgi:2-polyprenyl-3-methyl-5-hydroxy-6-metoxy-1,4-benzoquinol methylase
MVSPPRGKDAEVAYPSLLDESGQSWLRTKPFGGPTRETGRHLIDAGYIIQLLRVEPGSRLRICEVGCGSGWMSLMLGRAGAEVVGIDLAPDMIAIANERRDEERLPNVTFLVADMEDLPPDLAGSFDRILFYEALHHSPDAAAALRSARGLVRAGGELLLVEPNFKHRWEGRAATAQYGVTECGYSTRQLKRYLREAGFVDIERFHNNRKRLFSNAPGDIAGHLAEPLTYRFLAPFWTASWLRARAS